KFSSLELPSLPVPQLSATLDRLKIAATPFAASMEDFTHFCALVEQFGEDNKAGPKFHKLLSQKAMQTKNWLSHDWWTQKAYLEGRDSVMIWSNPAFIGPKVSNIKGKENVALFVSKVIAEAIHFKQLLQNGYTPDGDKQICNDQYMKIYGTTRIPGDLIDTISYGDIKDNHCS
ncbi:carnitine O-acetyltransferase-like isoform X1, partial [Leptotrombidium deliense]